MALRELLLPWDEQPQEAADVDLSTGFARRLTCLWTGAGYWYGPAEGTYSRAIGSADDVAAYGRGRTTFSVSSGTSDSGRLPDGSFGTAPAGTFVAVVRVPTGTANVSLKGGTIGDMQIRVTSGVNLVFVRRGVSVRITASGVVAQGGVYVVAGSYGDENRLYCNGVLVGVDSGNLVTAQGTGAYVGHDGGGAEDWSDGGIGLIAAWDRQLSTDEVRELSADPWQLFEPRRIFVPVSAGGGGGATDLTVAEASHGHSADSLTLTIGVSLAINDATHGHTSDSVTLTTASTLAVADATHSHAADQVTLTLAGSESLTIADATHAHTADAPVLSVDSLLAVDDALHAHSADNVVLGVTGAADLIIADATHAHSVDGLVLTTDSLLAIQDALHAHAADALTLDSTPTLLIADALHAHTSDGLALTVDAWLVIDDALHGHTADSITLGDSGAVVLVVADALHAHAADTPRLFYEVWAATKAPIGVRHASGARSARLSTTARPPRLSTRTR